MLQVTEKSEVGGRSAKWWYVLVAYVALSCSVTWALAQPSITPRLPLTLGLAGVTAVWLLAFGRWWPCWPDRRVWAVVGYVVLLALCCALVWSSQAFVVFVWIGYPFAFAIFPARWVVLAVTANSIGTFVAQGRSGSALSVSVALGLPVLIACWYAGVESERRRKAIAQLIEMNKRLTAALAENAGLHTQLMVQAREAGILDERQRMAREIHDTLAQELAAMIRQLQAADRVRDQPQQWEHHMDQVQMLARRSLSEARRSVQALRPAPLEQSRLPDAIADMATAWSRTSGVPLTVDTTGTSVPLITGIEVALFRVAQEALANVANHARASRVGITLSYLDDVVLLDIRDDGVGFDAPESSVPTEDSGYGLGTMRQRLLGVGGTLEIESGPGEGTAIGASVPAIRTVPTPDPAGKSSER
ncbi:sensor histidine kinase [Actinocrispum wychmicini]|uniref:Signal transduction histidine kinase n=1 Tax=Actinocrispum wychmicini TaxID=1213861 RepID=A0A4R2JTS8_9PSEU|nr:sensor histidine kinase [Actinocrispum wychmicini]TCO62577.1 signal transduction histidine kinase [Actinocrispum wychmicini]